ncbi:MAG: hypothetical protein HYV09_08770 [Deltaproteobacteria bacterium]|nr:hypothetical protein [Deltaproteobacteria bacterium]
MKWTVLAAFAALSCSRPEAAAPPAGIDSPTARSLLGAVPDYAFSVRIDRLRADPIYAAIIHDAAADESFRALFESVGAVDAVGAIGETSFEKGSFIGVLRGPPPLEKLPADWRKSIEEGGAARKLPSGIFEFASISKKGWPYGFYASDQWWVLLAGYAAGPGHDWFSNHTTAPPPVEFGGDVLAGFWLGGHAMKKPVMAKAAREPGSAGLEGLTLVLRDGAHGDVIYTGVYATSADAENAMNAAGKELGQYASVWKSLRDRCPGLSGLAMHGERSGRTVRIRITHVPEGIRAALSCKW